MSDLKRMWFSMPIALADALEAHASTEGISRNQAVRNLIAEGLCHEEPVATTGRGAWSRDRDANALAAAKASIDGTWTKQEAADIHDVSTAMVSRARSVLRHAPELARSVRRGETTLWTAYARAMAKAK